MASLLLAIGLAAVGPAAAAWSDRLALTLSDRIRGEVVDWFRPEPGTAPAGANRYAFFANQLRFGATLDFSSVRLVAALQDTRLVGLPDDASAPVPLGPGALYFAHTRRRDAGEPFLKLGFLEVDWDERLAFDLGRFDHAEGQERIPEDANLAALKRMRIGERLIGPFGYTHVTRSFDGVRVRWDRDGWNVTAVAMRPTHGGFEVSANRSLEDVDVAGLALTRGGAFAGIPTDARLFYFFYEDRRRDPLRADNRPREIRAADRRRLTIHSAGAHLLAIVPLGPATLDGLLWGVAQQGEWGALDHAAWAFAVEGGVRWPGVPGAPWLRLGLDRSSGDDDSADGDHGTFFQMLPTARIYAQLPFFNLMNVEDLFAQLLLRLHPRATVRLDWHGLRLTEPRDLWYAGGGATNEQVFGFAGTPSSGARNLAHVVEASLTLSLHERVTAAAYYGHAFGQGVVKGAFRGADADYAFLEATFRY